MTGFDARKKRAVKTWSALVGRDAVVYLGSASCGVAAGVRGVRESVERYISGSGREVSIVEVGCIGMCCFEPMFYVQAHGHPSAAFGPVEPKEAVGILEAVLEHHDYASNKLLGTLGEPFEDVPSLWDHRVMSPQKRIITENTGIIDPLEIDHYIARGGFEGLTRALAMDRAEVIQTVLDSGLRGRGGAGFPTGLKWRACERESETKKYMICNADEGDPGAFMDRSILEGDPFRLVEGLTIAAYAIGADEGFIYVRAEYPLAIDHLRHALGRVADEGLLGRDILGTGYDLTVHIKEGAGAFVCGEETALLASIEGRRGMPRPRPPFPAQRGLWGKPTVINNVKTLSSVPFIMRKGAAAFSAVGSKTSKGTAVFALTGKIRYPGLIEVPMGTTLRTILEEIGGGVAEGTSLKAVQTGGPSGGCIPVDRFDLGVDYESLQGAGAIMGSGGMVVMDQDTCMVDVARYFIGFTQYESCGKCPPCRIGTKKMKDILERISAGEGRTEDMETLASIGTAVAEGSLCGLGQTAPNPVLSTLRYFRDEYEAHISDHRCPAMVCKALIWFEIDADRCIGCTLCAQNCPSKCISGKPKVPHSIDQGACVRCGMCRLVCPKDAVMKCTNPANGGG